MIVKIKGLLEEITPLTATIHVQGISYQLQTCFSVNECLHEKLNQTVEIFVRQVFSENAQTLYGFSNSKERALFDFLRTLPGLGASLSMNIISTFGQDKLLQIIAQQDIAALTKVPGIGKTKSEKIMLEAKHKSKKIQQLMLDANATLPANISFEHIIHEALSQLGFQQKEIDGAQKKLQPQENLPPTDEEHLQEWIRLYLANI